MAVTLRKQQPASPSATSRIETAQSRLEETNRKLAQLHEQRNAALLRDDNGAAVAFGIEIANLKLAARADEDKISLLREAAAREAREREARERGARIEKIEKRLAERDAVGRELVEAVAAADRAFRQLIDIGHSVQSAWNWPASDVPAILLSPAAIAHALSAELYRIGARPKVGGGQVEPHGLHAGLNFPGSRCPRFELVHLPERIPALTVVLAEATAFASAIMRGKRSSAHIDVPVAVSIANGAVPRTEAQERLSALLQRQHELSEDISPQGELAYKAHMEQVRQAQDEVAAEKEIGASHA
jgi:hypothetical protein